MNIKRLGACVLIVAALGIPAAGTASALSVTLGPWTGQTIGELGVLISGGAIVDVGPLPPAQVVL